MDNIETQPIEESQAWVKLHASLPFLYLQCQDPQEEVNMITVDGLEGSPHLHSLHTKDVKFFTCLNERALDLRLRLMSLVRDLVRCLSTMDCLYPRDLPQPARKKKGMVWEGLMPLKVLSSQSPLIALLTR